MAANRKTAGSAGVRAGGHTRGKGGMFRDHANSVAFMVESLVLLAALIATMAVFTQLFAGSMTTTEQTRRTTEAAVIAQNAAEEFSSDAVSVAAGKPVGRGVAQGGTDGSGGFSVDCDVSSQPQAAGTIYKAHITVYDAKGTAYELDATRYVSEVD